MKLAYWSPIANHLVADPAFMRAVVPYNRRRAREGFLKLGWIAVGEWREQVSDQHADYFIRDQSVLLVENLEVIPLPGFTGWYRRTRETWRRKVRQWRAR